MLLEGEIFARAARADLRGVLALIGHEAATKKMASVLDSMIGFSMMVGVPGTPVVLLSWNSLAIIGTSVKMMVSYRLVTSIMSMKVELDLRLLCPDGLTVSEVMDS